MTPEDARLTIEGLGYHPTKQTKKVVEYRSTRQARVLYLRVDQGFPSRADVVVHPDSASEPLRALPGVTPHANVFRYGSNFGLFPKRLNTGAAPQHYGKLFHVDGLNALAAFCRAYDAA